MAVENESEVDRLTPPPALSKHLEMQELIDVLESFGDGEGLSDAARQWLHLQVSADRAQINSLDQEIRRLKDQRCTLSVEIVDFTRAEYLLDGRMAAPPGIVVPSVTPPETLES